MAQQIFGTLAVLFFSIVASAGTQTTRATGEYHRVCGPTGGAGVELRLLRFRPEKPEAHPEVRIVLEQFPVISVPTDVEWQACVANGECHGRLRGQINLNRVFKKKLSGQYTLVLQNGEKETGSFVLESADSRKPVPGTVVLKNGKKVPLCE